jgi:actin-like ATPase involved in cell morphogenesis
LQRTREFVGCGRITYFLGIDVGTTFTAAALWRDGVVESATLGNTATVMPSVALLREDGELLLGDAAERRAASEPERVGREFKRRVGDSVPVMLGGTPFSADALQARVVRWVVDAVSREEGAAPAHVVVTHPANWGEYKVDLLRQALRQVDLESAVTLRTEPEAAAVHYAARERIPEGSVVAVYDLGGGTFDAAVLRRTDDGWALLGTPDGVERLGGMDFDAAVLQHVIRTIGDEHATGPVDDPGFASAMARLRRDCVTAKEALSSDTDVAIPVLLPTLQTEARLTRRELEGMIRPALQQATDALHRTVRSAGLAAGDVHAVLLAGGSSRIPLVGELVGAELGRPVAVDAHPKHVVALGAARLAAEHPVPEAIVPAPTADPEPVALDPEPAGPPSASGRRRRRMLVIGAVVTAVVALLAVALAPDGSQDQAEGDVTTRRTAAPATDEGSATTDADVDPDSTVTTSTSEAGAPQPGASTTTTGDSPGTSSAPAPPTTNPSATTSTPPAGQIEVPNVVDMLERKAMSTLTLADLTYERRTEHVTDLATDNKVLTQNPAPGTRVAPGTKVTITVAQCC